MNHASHTLFVLLIASYISFSVAFTEVGRELTLEEARILDTHEPSEPFFEPEFFSRISGPGRNETCNFEGNPTRTMTLGSDYENKFKYPAISADPQFTFFKTILAWNDSRIMKERKMAVNYLKAQFGDFVDTPSVPVTPIRMNTIIRKLADSEKLTPCANTTAVLAGWTFSGRNLKYGGRYAKMFAADGESTVMINAPSQVYYLYLVFSPGARYSTKMKLVPTFPSVCSVTGTCGQTFRTGFFDAFHESYPGYSDHSAVSRRRSAFSKGTGDTILRITLGWPGRFRFGEGWKE